MGFGEVGRQGLRGFVGQWVLWLPFEGLGLLILPWRDLEDVLLVSQTERPVLHDLAYMWDLRKPNS